MKVLFLRDLRMSPPKSYWEVYQIGDEEILKPQLNFICLLP